MNNELEEKRAMIQEQITELEKRLEELKEEEKELALYIMNKNNDIEGQLNVLEKDIVDYDENKTSTYFAKYIEKTNIKVFSCLNNVDNPSLDEVKTLIESLYPKLESDNIDERYIAMVDVARECSRLIDNGATFTLIVIDNDKTYAFAEGKTNIYKYDNGKIEVLELTNKLGELTLEVLNNNEYIRLIVFSHSDIEDLYDDKIKIITKMTNRETLVKSLI